MLNPAQILFIGISSFQFIFNQYTPFVPSYKSREGRGKR